MLPSASPETSPRPDGVPAVRPLRPARGDRFRRHRARLARRLRRAAPALIGYAAVRLLGLVVLALWAHAKGHGLWPQLAAQWDSKWYLGIADHGYDRVLTGARDSSDLAFFPLYPVLVKGVAGVTPGSRATIGLLLSLLASLFAAWGIFAVGDRLHGRAVGAILAVLWGSTPVALVQWMGYTESLFTAMAAWSLYAVLTGRWVWAGSLSLLAGLTRPTGIAVATAVTVCALILLWRRRGTAGTRRARIALGAALAPLGWLGYITWVGLRLHRWDGYFAVQRTWTNELDWGVRTLRDLRANLMYQSRPELFLVIVSVSLVAAGLLYLLSLADRQPLPLLVFTGILLLIGLGSGGVYFPRARFLLPGFPLLLPIALAVAHGSARTKILVIGGAALSSAYFGAYMALVWPSAP